MTLFRFSWIKLIYLNLFTLPQGDKNEELLIFKSAGYIDFNSTKYIEEFTRREWILEAPELSKFEQNYLNNQIVTQCRIFVEEINLPIESETCPLNKRVIIGGFESSLEESSIAYCGQLTNFEINIFTNEVHVLLLTPIPSNEIIIRFHFGFVKNSTHTSYLQSHSYETCTFIAETDIPNVLFSRLFACRPIFTGLISETQCISNHQICDGMIDCPRGEDESSSTCKLESLMFLEQLRQIEMLSSKSILTNSSDYKSPSSKSPEIYVNKCKNGEFKCESPDINNSFLICISKWSVCDGYIDCPLGDDEKLSTCFHDEHGAIPVINRCPKDNYYCRSDSKCLQSRFVCDGIQDCLNNADESESACQWKMDYPKNGTSKKEENVHVLSGANSHRTEYIEWGILSNVCLNPSLFYCKNLQICLPIEYLCHSVDDCPVNIYEGQIACEVIRKSILSKASEFSPEMCHETMETPSWIAKLYIRDHFICPGVLIEGQHHTFWVLVLSECAKYMEESELLVFAGNSTSPHRVQSRTNYYDELATNQSNQFSLLKLDLSISKMANETAMKPFDLVGINLTVFEKLSIEDNYLYITPIICKSQKIRFGFQHVEVLPFSVCEEVYPEFKYSFHHESKNVACVKQSFCIQGGLKGALLSQESLNNFPTFRGFVIYGSDCFLGQMSWPVIIVMPTLDTYKWIVDTTECSNESKIIPACGKTLTDIFPWFIYFNIPATQTYCLGIHVSNDRFPLVTSATCLMQCLQANMTVNGCNLMNISFRLDRSSGKKDGSIITWNIDNNLDKVVTPVCPAKNVFEVRWIDCLVFYLSDNLSTTLSSELIIVYPFFYCASESFYNPILQNESLCIEGFNNRKLSCINWTDSAIVQCSNPENNQWHLIGLAPPCNNQTESRWLLRILHMN